MPSRPGRLAKFREGYGEVPRPIPVSVMAVSLAASVAKSVTVPTTPDAAIFALFSGTSNFYVNCYTTATVPGDTSDGSASELNPSGYYLYPDVTTLSIISPVACVVTVSFYRQ